MADNIKDINDEIKKLKDALGIIHKSGENFLKKDIDEAKTKLQELRGEFRELNSDLKYISDSFRQSVDELSKQNNELSKSKSALNNISSISSKLSSFRKGDLDLSKQEMANLQIKAKAEFASLKYAAEKGLWEGKTGLAQQQEIKDAAEKLKIFEKGWKEIDNLRKDISKDKGVQLFSGVSDLVSSLPGLRKFAEPFQDAAKAAKDASREKIITGSGTSGFMAGLKSLGPSLAKAFGPLALIAMFVEGLGKADKETTELNKSMALNTAESVSFRYNLVAAAVSSRNINITATKLLETFSSLNKQFGFITNFANDTLVTTTKLTKVIGIGEESANNLAAASELNGTSFEKSYKTSLSTSYEMQRQVGVQFDLRDILEESGKITGQIRANLGANPAKIAEAVTQSKLFGASLQEVNEAGKSFLDFESSISNELQAELLLGKDINLEGARRAALNGDQVSLAKELTKQAGSFSEYSKMNVLQQQSLAAAIGMSSDQLSNILFKQAIQGKNAKDLRALGEDELAQRLESQTLADKFSATMDKLKSIVTDLATVFMPVLNIVGSILSTLAGMPLVIGLVASAMVGLAAKSIAVAMANMIGASALAGPIGLGVGVAAALAMGAYLTSMSMKPSPAGDIISPADGRTQISTKEGGLFNLSKNDDVVAGPGIANKINQPVASVNMSETNILLRQILTKQGTVKIDNTQIGTAFAMNTFEIQ